jgi:hypothetical protein
MLESITANHRALSAHTVLKRQLKCQAEHSMSSEEKLFHKGNAADVFYNKPGDASSRQTFEFT